MFRLQRRHGGGDDGDVVSSILAGLHLQDRLPLAMVDQLRDGLQLLRSRKPAGSLGMKNDTERKRACAMLEYLVRESSSSRQQGQYDDDITTTTTSIPIISMDDLVQQARTKSKGDFVKFHQLIGNLRDHWATTTTSKTATSKTSGTNGNRTATTAVGRAHKKASNIAAGAGSRSNDLLLLPHKSSIPLLAVQLGAFVPNSNVVAKQAQSLFQNILQVIQTKHYGERKYALQDVQQKQRAYEAACFYLVAAGAATTNTTAQQTKSRSSSSSRQKAKLSLSNNTDQTNSNKHHHKNNLDLSTFLEATKDFSRSEFEMILEYVQDLKAEVDNSKDDDGHESSTKASSAAAAAAATASRKRPRHGSSSSDHHQASNKRAAATFTTVQQQASTDSSVDTTRDLLLLHQANEQQQQQQQRHLELLDRAAATEELLSEAAAISIYHPIFLEWKRKVLESALEAAAAAANENEQHNNTTQGQEVTHGHDEKAVNYDDEAFGVLGMAVKEILIRRGLQLD